MKDERTLVGDTAALTHIGRVRAANEDAVVAARLPDRVVVLAVADGVGGLYRGDIASSAAIGALHSSLREGVEEDPAASLHSAFTAANLEVLALGAQSGQTMASTLVAALVRRNEAWVGNLGDSRAYLLRGSGLEQLTRDHSLSGLDYASASEVPAGDCAHVITRAIGVDEAIDPDISGPVELPEESTLMLCSDGLHRVVDEARIAEVLRSSASQAAAELIRLANGAGGPDNVSVAVYQRARLDGLHS